MKMDKIILVCVASLFFVGCQSKDYDYYKSHPAQAKTKAIECGASNEGECLGAKKAFKEHINEKAKKTSGSNGLFN